MLLISGSNLSKLVDYSFGDQRASWDTNLIGGFMKLANATNQEFLAKAKEFEGRVMTLYIDNIRLYPRHIETTSEADKYIVNVLMSTNNLLALCSLLPNNQFIIFTGEEDTPIDDKIVLPHNILRIYAVNAVFNNERIIPFPFGVQRQIGQHDNRQQVLQDLVEKDEKIEPTKLLYINCGIERNPERLPLSKFEGSGFTTTRFDKDSKFFPYERYNEFLSELRDHKFVVCPKGHGYDTHRIWETLYMRRIPVMLDDPYFRKLLEGFPVLFINKWEELLPHDFRSRHNPEYILWFRNNYLWEEAQTMDMSKLDLEKLYASAIM